MHEVSNVRYGHAADLAAVARLLERSRTGTHIDPWDLAGLVERDQLIVLPCEADELAAAACIAPGRGIVFLVMDPAHATPELEHRMVDVADALIRATRPSVDNRSQPRS